jgi:hypothetical protein
VKTGNDIREDETKTCEPLHAQSVEEGKRVDVLVVCDGEMAADARDALEGSVQTTHFRARAVVRKVGLGFDWSVRAGQGGQGAARVVETACCAHACDAVCHQRARKRLESTSENR